MIPFKFTQVKKGQTLEFTIEGQIDDHSEFPTVAFTDIDQLNINVSNVSFINSGGVRKWILWNREIGIDKPNFDLTYIDLPTVLSKQVVSIDGFIASTAKLQSMIIPFYCDECGHGFKCLFEKGMTLGGRTAAEMISLGCIITPCPKCSKSAEVDGNPKHFTNLMNRF